jgi:ABC-type maltose transport system permease subunit
MNQNIKNILRWIAVIPTALIASILIIFPIRWFVFFSGISETWVADVLKHIGLTITIDNIERLLNALFVGGTFVYAGAKMAPNHQFKTAIG